MYSLQLNCTYSNYTEAASICSAAQESRRAHLLYKTVQNVLSANEQYLQ